MQIYGSLQSRGKVDELTGPSPGNMYALTHLMCESLLEMLWSSSRLNSTVLRLANGFGPPTFPSSSFSWLAMNDFCRSAVQDGVILLKSDGAALRDFIFVEDVCRAVELAAVNCALGSNVYNVASSHTISILEAAHLVADLCSKLTGSPVEVRVPSGLPENLAPTSEGRFHVMSGKILREAGFAATVSLGEGVRRTLQYYLSKEGA